MANVDGPFGFRAVQNEAGTIPKLETFSVANGVTIYQGSPVCLADTGLVTAYTTTLAVEGAVLGVSNNYVVGATGTTDNIQVYTDPNQLYEMQVDDNSLITLTSYKGALFSLVNAASGNGTTLQSIAEIDGSSATTVTGAAATNVKPIRVEGVSRRINNETNVSFTVFQVRWIPPVHHRGMAKVGLPSNTTFTGIL